MTLTALAAVPPDTFSDSDRETAREASRALARLSGRGCVRVEADAGVGHEYRQTFVLPAPAVQLLTHILVELAEGRSVSVVPTDAELTTQQAADMLNISRPYLIRLIEEGSLTCHKVGTHRRITLQDLLTYRKERDARAHAAMDALVEQAQEHSMGY